MNSISRLVPLSNPQALVACNVYVSAGRAHHSRLLFKLLADAHIHCQLLREKSEKIAIVHAYADGPYDRSSFHLAGSPGAVVDVASALAINAIEGLATTTQASDVEESQHPFIGLVDHVSVMPLQPLVTSRSIDMPPHGTAAKQIGERLKQRGVQVFYYGYAHSQALPLATVRREKTDFFRTGGLKHNRNHTKPGLPANKGAATVGAPPMFVENFNIRLTPNCNFAIAKSLTSFLRERDGGLLGVEALTLPYGQGRFEMAANLLRPDVVSAKDILAKLDEWVELKLKEMPFDKKSDLVEAAYRVGTTAEQCMRVIDSFDSTQDMTVHDQQVMEQFKGYLMNH